MSPEINTALRDSAVTHAAHAAHCAHCPSCGAAGPVRLGPIPASPRFAGNLLPHAIPGGNLYRCTGCALWFRHPRLSPAALGLLYAYGSPQAWSGESSPRPDWALIRAHLRRFLPRGRVLDVGCFDGELLASLGDAYACFGVEMNMAAAQRARARGVTLLARDIDQLAHSDERFDALIATDVVEHMADPRRFLGTCARLLAPGGLMLVSTGSTDAWTWRLMGGGYWYCANAEHLSFLNEAWVRRCSALLGLTPVALETFAHDPSRLRAAAQLAMNLAYRVAPGVLSGARRWLARDPQTRAREDLRCAPPSWSTARDHMLFALQAAPL